LKNIRDVSRETKRENKEGSILKTWSVSRETNISINIGNFING